MKSLNQPNYITKRENSLSLDGEWRFIWRDEKTSVKDLVFPYTAHLPNSVQYCLFEAGLLPHPYMSDSAEAYEWVDHKVWYFKREFFLPKKCMKDRVFLCCDGISYYSTLYVNGEEIGAHEGMFGGPYINIEQYLIPDAVNELIFEVVAPSRFPVKSMAKFPRKEIYPWAVDDRYDGEYFVVMGIWREVRLEFCDKIHLNRPFISTVRCNERTARLHLECDVCDERTDELKNASNHKEGCFVMSFDDGYPKNPYDSGYFVRTEVREKGTDKVVFDSEKPVEFYERGTCIYQNNVIMPYLFLEDFTIKNPRLWWPNGMGSPVLYDCKIELLNAAKNVVDVLKFDFGIRTIGQEYTKAKKLYNPHEKFQFVVNGKKIFIKGCDFCNPDMLYKQDFEKIDWLISLVKNAGINLIRIWNGGNSVESDYFYECCDRNGIMVWQDLLLANNYDAHLWDCETAECQLSVNIQRVRNHPALAVYCGGNEYNENIFNCSQAVATTILTTQKNDFTRRLYITTPYAGSAHIYKDFEPTWFKKCYKELSFLSESGLAGFPDYKTYRKYMADKKGLDTFIFSEEKGITALENVICTSTGIGAYPATLEWTRSVTEINGEFLSEIFLCGNLAVSEFYRFMIEAMRSQYPKTTGVMPWTFNRFSVALMAYQCVDYEGVPTSVYYALKRAYKKVAFFADVSRLRRLPGENIVLSGSIVNEGLESNPVLAQAFIFNSAGEELYFKEKTVSLKGYKQPLNFGTYTLDPKISNDCLFFAIRLISNDEVIYKSVYTLRVDDALLDEKFFQRYETEFVPMKDLNKSGIRLKDCLKKNIGTFTFSISDLVRNVEGVRFNLTFKNENKFVYPVIIESSAFKFTCSDNYFCLLPDEQVVVECLLKDPEKKNEVSIRTLCQQFEKYSV